jgi:hypothetical protein
MPVSISPDGASLLTQAGVRLDGKTFQVSSSPFYPKLPDAVWGNDSLYTIHGTLNYVMLWRTFPFFDLLRQSFLPWRPRALLGLPVDDDDLVVAVGYDPMVQFAIFSPKLEPLSVTPLRAPMGLKTSFFNEDKVYVECDPVPGAHSYLFQVKEGDEGEWRDLSYVFGSNPPQTHLDPLKPNVRYYFRVNVQKGQLTSAFSKEVSFIWDLPAPAKPVLTSVVVDEEGHAVVTWDPVPDAHLYRVQRRNRQEGIDDWGTVESNALPGATTVTDNAVERGNSYSYRVIAVGRKDLQSEPSDEMTVSIPIVPGLPEPTATPVPPKPDGVAPSVEIQEGNHLVTAKRTMVLHAKASDNRGVEGVEFVIGTGKRNFAPKRGGAWEIRVPLKDRLTYVRVRARDAANNYSQPQTVVIFQTTPR